MLRSVLIVDDNEADLVYTRLMLERSGKCQHILQARHGEEALSLFEDLEESKKTYPGAFPPLLIFLDINMPRSNGFEFLEAWHSKALDCRVVMLTSSINPKDRRRAEAFSAVAAYETKPLTVERVNELAQLFGEASS